MSRILIVDDNETLREGAASVVRKMGHEADAQKGGAEGVLAFKKQPHDMVFTDLKMEGTDGIALLDQVRQIDEDAIVVIMTGYGTVSAAVEAMKKGAFDFIEKPFSPDLLRAKVTAGLRVRDERRSRERAEGLASTAHCVHGTDNLYVADPSVFPSAPSVDPSLTIMAFFGVAADLLHARL
jgi:two-component system, NtrC family, response regulator HydG